MYHPGEKFGDYALVRKLGSGQFAVVWLAEKDNAGAFALKIPFKAEQDQKAFLKEVMNGAKASGHPNISSVIDAFVHHGQVVIVCEYAPDGSLRSWLDGHGGKPVAVDGAIRLITGILKGLGHLHAQDIVHRDIKPDNVLLHGETPKIADFGFARTVPWGAQSLLQVNGTPQYMAPEVFAGTPQNRLTDLWSVGVMFFEMLAGRHPFPVKDNVSLINQITDRQPLTMPEGLHPTVVAVLVRATDKRPENRYQTASDFIDALSRYPQHGGPVPGKGAAEGNPGNPPPAPAEAKRHPAAGLDRAAWSVTVLESLTQLDDAIQPHVHVRTEFHESTNEFLEDWFQKRHIPFRRTFPISDEAERMQRLKRIVTDAQRYVYAVTLDAGNYIELFWSGEQSCEYMDANRDARELRAVVIKRVFVLGRDVIAGRDATKRRILERILEFHEEKHVSCTVIGKDRLLPSWNNHDTSFLICDDQVASESYSLSDNGQHPGYVAFNDKTAVTRLKKLIDHLTPLPNENWMPPRPK